MGRNASLDKMIEVKLIDRDHDEYLKEVFNQDLLDNFTVKDKVARVKKLQKDLIMDARSRKKKFDKLQAVIKMDRDKIRYIMNYHSGLMISEESIAWKHWATTYKMQGSSEEQKIK